MCSKVVPASVPGLWFQAYAHHIADLYDQGGNLALMVAEATAKAYGFESLDAFEDFAKRKAGA